MNNSKIPNRVKKLLDKIDLYTYKPDEEQIKEVLGLTDKQREMSNNRLQIQLNTMMPPPAGNKK